MFQLFLSLRSQFSSIVCKTKNDEHTSFSISASLVSLGLASYHRISRSKELPGDPSVSRTRSERVVGLPRHPVAQQCSPGDPHAPGVEGEAGLRETLCKACARPVQGLCRACAGPVQSLADARTAFSA